MYANCEYNVPGQEISLRTEAKRLENFLVSPCLSKIFVSCLKKQALFSCIQPIKSSRYLTQDLIRSHPSDLTTFLLWWWFCFHPLLEPVLMNLYMLLNLETFQSPWSLFHLIFPVVRFSFSFIYTLWIWIELQFLIVHWCQLKKFSLAVFVRIAVMFILHLKKPLSF